MKAKIVNPKQVSRGYQEYANYLAKKAGFNRATGIVQIKTKRTGVVKSQASGYRKNTTGEYVPNSYRSKFGWKNTYYQHAVCIVNIGV